MTQQLPNSWQDGNHPSLSESWRRPKLRWAQLVACKSTAQAETSFTPPTSPVSISLLEETQGSSHWALTQVLLLSGEVTRPNLLPVLTHHRSLSFGHLTSYHLPFWTKIPFFPLSNTHADTQQLAGRQHEAADSRLDRTLNLTTDGATAGKSLDQR